MGAIHPGTERITSVLITGANAGIGRELALQLGSRLSVQRVILGCRSRERGLVAREQLAGETGRNVFELLPVDVADLHSVRRAAALLDPVDAVVLNAGGSGGSDPRALTADGVTQIFAVNVLGHVALLESLLDERKVGRAAIFVGSEAARGVPRLHIPRPSFPTGSVAEFAAVIDGTAYAAGRFNGAAAYGEVKYLGALWMAALARRRPGVRLVTVSPGGTRGTGTAKAMPPLQRFVYDRILMGIVVRTVTHTVAVGAARLVAAVEDTSYAGGRFYASAGPTLTGPVVDQAAIFADFADEARQDHAYDAIHRHLPARSGSPA